MKKWDLGILLLICLSAFVVRLYHFTAPIADWHSWRQVDTSAVSRNFVQNGFDLLHPRFEDISNVASGLDNPQGYRFVEFPVYNVLQAGGYMLFKTFTLEEWGRLVTILASLASLIFIYLIARKYISFTGALAAAVFFALDPFNVYYSRVVLPDPSMVATTLACIYFFDLFVTFKRNFTGKIVYFVLATLFGALALLLKPYAAFFLLPLLYISWREWTWKMIQQPLLWVFLIAIAAPLTWWRIWMLQYPAGIPASGWLFNGGNIRFTGAFFYWIFANRFTEIILGLWGLPLFVFGILSKRKSFFFFLSFVLSSLLYVTIIARGNVQHDYYQILIIPSIAFMIGLGADRLAHLPRELGGKFAILSIMFVSIVGCFGFGWYFVRNYYNTNESLVATAQVIDALTPKNAKILTFMNGDTTFLYYTKRQGWASLEKSLPEMIAMGADYIAIPNPTPNDLSGFGKQYGVVALTSQYLIINLHQVMKQ
ncbi:MAG TPA: glycosyltransferase family 39 protein [Patescibacteria group bacterium]|nr:glycosyltransferase family 39 protein [Patescibacteria group bacterium]